MKVLEKWKKLLEILSFYTSVPKIMFIGYTVPEIWCVTDVIIFHFGRFFTPLTARKMKILKKWKEHLEILSFYTSIPKIIIICYTVPEIWWVTGVIIIFHFGLFFALLLPKQSKVLKKWKKRLEIWSFYTCVPKIKIRWWTVPEKWYVTDGRTEKVTHRGGCPT